MRVAILLTVESFEHFFGSQLGLTRDDYVERYRNDWAWDYCRMLRGERIEPILYVPSLAGGGLRTAEDGFSVRFVPIGAAYRPWVRLPVLKRTPLGRFVAQLVSAMTMLPAMRAALRRDGIDALIVQEYWTARFDLFAARLGTPVIAVDQGLPDRREVKWLKRRTLPRAAAIVVQTLSEAAKVRRFGGAPVQLPNAVNTDLFSPGGEPDPGLIVSVARLHDAHKRQSDLLRAVALLPGQWRLELVGDGPDRGRLEALAQQLGIAQRVVFAGFVSDRRQLRELLRRCSVFALPSAYEGLPVALLEAMSCGAPTVATRIRATAEVLEDGVNGRLVPVGDPDALAIAIADAGRQRARLSFAGRATVEQRFSEHIAAPALAEICRAATGQRPARA